MSSDLQLTQNLLTWYRSKGRTLPWRGVNDPYLVWISEILLQQTRVEQGKGYYERFVERFPSVQELSDASIDEVLYYWKGLGYYSRALNLHRAAKIIVSKYKGVFPNNYKDILSLPGVGPYTASAISSLCFQEPRAAIDGNLYRVLSRVFTDTMDIGSNGSFRHFSNLAERIMPINEPGEFNQALMDLGATICKPKNPSCSICPIALQCNAFATGTQLSFPVKMKKVKVSDQTLIYYFLYNKQGFLSKKRGDESIWKFLYEFLPELPKEYSGKLKYETKIKHKLSHRNLTVKIYSGALDSQKDLSVFGADHEFNFLTFEESKSKSFPRPLDVFLENWIQGFQN